MMADGRVVIDTKLDDKGLKTGITGLQNTSISALKKVKNVLATVGIGVGVAAAVKGINNMIKSTAQLTDRIDKQSQKIGLSRKAYQEWDFVFSQFGTSVDGLQVGIKTLSTAMDEANDGTKEYTELFDRLKVNIHDTNGELKDQETIFNEVFAALAGMENQTERSAIASRLLGRSATELAPALNGGADAIEELREKAYDLGLVLDDTTVDIGVKLTDTLDQMKRAMQTASARAIEPLMGVVNDMAGSFTENAIPAIEKFLTKAFKVGLSIPPIFSFMKAVVTTVLKEIGEALDEPWEKFKGFVNDIVNMPVVQNTIELTLELAGDLYAGLKKGVQSGDWSDFWKASINATQFAIGIGATLFLAKGAASAISIWASSQAALVGAGFSKFNLASGALVMASIGLAMFDAMEDGDWTGLANNLTAALTAALIAGGLTKSPMVGALAFSVAINFKLGEMDIMSGLFGDPEEAAENVKKFFKDVWDMTGLETWWDEIGREIGDTIIQGILNAFRLFDIVGAVVDLFNNTPVGKFLGMFDFVGGAIDLGKVINEKLYGNTPLDLSNIPIEGGDVLANDVGVVLAKSLEESADESTVRRILANKLLPDSAKAELLLKSTEMGKQIVAGLKDGSDAGIKKYASENANALLETFREVWGIHSPSEETTEMGRMLMQGLIDGLIELFPELESEAEDMVKALEKIWAEGEYKPPVPASAPSGNIGGMEARYWSIPTAGSSSSGGGSGSAWGDIKAGWKSARTEMSTEVADWTGWASEQFMQIGPAFGNALGAGMRSLGQSLANKQATIEALGQSISDIEDTLSDAYEDLQDAQDDYADAVLSGDEDAIKAAKKRVDQQEKLIDGYEEQLTALKDEKKAVEDGSKAWSDFAKVVLGALADELYGLGASLAARAALAAVTFDWASAGIAAAGSVAAFAAAIAVDAWAGSFADGGIVPGTSYSGDRMVANVNSGELILNAAQQDRIASQLAMYSHLTDLLSSLQFASRGGITVNMAGATIYGLNEEAVGKAIYHNVRSLQAEGVIGGW
jgi:predicted  nucleic acid-binding Zn-ribbon protein